ncbi:MAG: NAD-dependent dehydratase [Proteobacteria bacterium]|nr:MAG: NAD-dependent dehydratase [Pseudomonadota bacterium]
MSASVAPHRPVLVSGGAGFLGSHLCERLLHAGETVVCIDNFSTSSRADIEHLLAHPRFTLREMDVSELDALRFERVGAIYNMACPASPLHYQRNPLGTLFTSIRGTDNLLRLARRSAVRMFQASTSEIYGHPSVHPQNEHYWGHVNTMGPRACYDEGKRCAETLCYIYSTRFAVSVRIARIFNTYGPRMRLNDGRVVVNFICQALRNRPITVYGDGRQTRSFCYVDDMIEAIVRMMDERNRCHGPINIGNPAEVPIVELARLIVQLTGSRSSIVCRPLPKDDPPRRRPDISLAREVLGWQPGTALQTGLALTIHDVERRLRAGRRRRRSAAAVARDASVEGARAP